MNFRCLQRHSDHVEVNKNVEHVQNLKRASFKFFETFWKLFLEFGTPTSCQKSQPIEMISSTVEALQTESRQLQQLCDYFATRERDPATVVRKLKTFQCSQTFWKLACKGLWRSLLFLNAYVEYALIL